MVNELNQQIIITNCRKNFKTHKKKKEKILMPRPTNMPSNVRPSMQKANPKVKSKTKG